MQDDRCPGVSWRVRVKAHRAYEALLGCVCHALSPRQTLVAHAHEMSEMYPVMETARSDTKLLLLSITGVFMTRIVPGEKFPLSGPCLHRRDAVVTHRVSPVMFSVPVV